VTGVEGEGGEQVMEKVDFISDIQERNETFKSLITSLQSTLQPTITPQNPQGEEGLLLVATPSGQIIQMASEALKPMVTKPEGKKMIQTLLSAK